MNRNSPASHEVTQDRTAALVRRMSDAGEVFVICDFGSPPEDGRQKTDGGGRKTEYQGIRASGRTDFVVSAV